MKQNVAKNIPLSEITLRKYERPYKMSRRDLIKKLCLSIGLLQPGDSRDIIVDVLQVLLDKKTGVDPKTIQEEVINYRKKSNLPLNGIAGSNIRRQLKRLKDLYIIEKRENIYRINENENLDKIFEEKIKKFYILPIIYRVKEYFDILK
tara:strand:+ start:812 stop:1258 length:447 start_codon:yes stop_codon:yes gene_type:complete